MRLFSLSVLLAAVAVAIEIPIKRVQREPNSVASGIPIDYNDGSNAYVGVVSIGSPGQDLNVAFDVRTSALWMPDASCACGVECENAQLCSQLCAAHCCTKITGIKSGAGTCTNKNVFDPSKSTTYVKGRRTTKLPFLNNTIEANISYDTFRMGPSHRPSPTAKNFQFGLVKEFGGSYKDLSYDGVFGIGMAAEGGLPSAIKQLADHGVIPSPILTAYFLPQTPDKIVDGVLTLGQPDRQRCGPIQRFINADKGEGWAFSSPSFNITGSYSSANPEWKGILDFSTDNVHVPKAVILAFVHHTAGRIDEKNRITYSCSKSAPLNFNLGGERVTLSASQLSVPFRRGQCMIKFKETEPSATYAFRFGTSILTNNCAVFDYNGRLALPKKKK